MPLCHPSAAPAAPGAAATSRARGRAGWALLALSAVACGGRAPASDPTDPEAPAAGPPPGFWFEARARTDVDLGHLGYAAGTRPEAADAAPGARVLDAARMAPGVNLYCSGHAPEARLIDAAGETLHVWSVDYDALAGVPPLKHPTQRAWRRVRLMPDGGLLALHEALALLRLDADSNLVWSVALGAHHDFDVDAEGRVHLLVRRAVEHPEIAQGRTIVDDGVVLLAPDGSVERRISILEALARSPWSHALDEAAQIPDGRTLDPGDGLARDLLHVNAYALLTDVPAGLPEAFAPGRALICLRELDSVAVLDLATERVVWLLRSACDAPHDPELDPEGRLWLFDNGLHRGWSRALALDPRTGREARQWPTAPDPGYFSEVCGALQVLPGGNLLLTESTAGRACEVTPEGQVVWSFATPHRVAGPEGPLVACLFEVERIPPALVPARCLPQ